MRIKVLQNDDGVAVIIAIAIIAVIVAVAFELNLRVRSEIKTTSVSSGRIKLNEMASSAIQMGMLVLIKDKKETQIDSIQEDWADETFLDTLMEDIPFENGTVKLKISDELSRLQVNSLVIFPEGRSYNPAQRDLWEKFLTLLIENDEAQEANDANAIIDSVKDWLDSGDDDATEFKGAESDYYMDLDPPYPCKNGPFTHLDELLLVKGITAELFAGVGGLDAISQYMSVHGASQLPDGRYTFYGKININTAELPIVTALLPIGSEDLGIAIVEYRQFSSDGEFVNDLSSPTWYRNAPGCGDLKINAQLITNMSDIFRLQAVASLEEVSMTITAVVQREKEKKTGKWTCRILSWDSE